MPTKANQNRARKFGLRASFLLWRRCSHHMTLVVPPYMTRCVHLSMNCTSSKGVSGKKGVNDRMNINARQSRDRGYLLNEK